MNPFDRVRNAVLRGKPDPAFVVVQPAVARYDANLGGLVATFPAVGYARWLDSLATNASVTGLVELFLGQVSPVARITLHGDGSAADYTPPSPRLIPGGVPLLVRWTTTDSTATASVTAQFRQVVM